MSSLFVRRAKMNRGQSLTEMALMLPIVMMLLAGVLDLGRVYFTFLALRDSAAEGAAYASLDPTNTAEIIARAKAESPSGFIDWSSATVNVEYFTLACRGHAVKVTVTTTYHLFTPFIGSIVGSQTLPLTANVVNTILTPAC